MGLRGPIGKSSAQAALDGNTGHRPPAPQFRPHYFAPECPKKLTGAARRIWEAHIESLGPLGILTAANAFALAHLCEDMADMEELQAGRRRMVADLQKTARLDARRLKVLAQELAKATPPEERGKLLAERAEITGRKLPGGADVALAMSQEGRRLLSEINRYAGRIARREMQFGLTPASAARMGEGGMGSAPPPQQVDDLEMSIQ